MTQKSTSDILAQVDVANRRLVAYFPSRDAVWAWYRSGGDLLIFIAIWLFAALFIGQDRVATRWNFNYWMAILPAVVFPLIRFRQTIGNLLLGKARPIGYFGIVAGAWLAFRGDISAIPPLGLFVLVASWASRQEVALKIAHLVVLLLGFYVAGSALYAYQSATISPADPANAWMSSPPSPTVAASDLYSDLDQEKLREAHSRMSYVPDASVEAQISHAPLLPDQNLSAIDINPWGVLPGQTIPAFGGEKWRISITPKISTSALFSLLMLLILLVKWQPSVTRLTVSGSAVYFAILSFVRAVFISLALFTATFLAMKLVPKKPVFRVAVAFAATAGLIAAVWVSPTVLYHLQSVDLVSRLLLRGETGLSEADVYRQLYRPWLWGEHVKLFWNSGSLMGLGSTMTQSASENLLNANQARSDSDSLLTRMLAMYGLPLLGLIYFFAERCYSHAKANDVWAVAMLATLIWLMMTWGSSFHPSNGIFALAFLIIGRGSEPFMGPADGRRAV